MSDFPSDLTFLEIDRDRGRFRIRNANVCYFVVLAIGVNGIIEVVGIDCPACGKQWGLNELGTRAGKCDCGHQFPGS